MRDAATDKIRALNDAARQSFTGCRVVITRGIAELDGAVRDDIIRQVKTYDSFTAANDPYGEHDFGAFHSGQHHVFWKWDYYDVDFAMQSPDASDAAVTARVLTIMLADEY